MWPLEQLGLQFLRFLAGTFASAAAAGISVAFMVKILEDLQFCLFEEFVHFT